MIDRAIEKLTEEMMQIDDPLAQLVEEHLTSLCTSEPVAQKLLAPGKSLKELHGKIWDEAKRRKKGNGAYIPDEEIYRMADDYYEITADKTAPAGETINVLDFL